MKSNETPPVVFVGPTAPASEILSILPEAIIRPPARRGDLYALRILKHSVFLVLDGVFGSALAISPREVIDVAKDGALVVGASSMGALRAADCFPAGVRGVGTIFRLYRSRAISSEDEVAITYREDKPFPPLTEPLINMRIALRRATRKGLLDGHVANRILSEAEAAHFSVRTWAHAYQKAGCAPSVDLQRYLGQIDVKRADAVLAANRVASLLRGNEAVLEVPARQAHLFGLLGEGRERSSDPLDGAARHEIATEFIDWLCVSGRIHHLVDDKNLPEINWWTGKPDVPVAEFWNILHRTGDAEAELMRFNVFRRAVSEASRLRLRPNVDDFNLAERQLADAHGTSSWDDLLDRMSEQSPLSMRLGRYRDDLALTKVLKRKLFSLDGQSDEPKDTFLWQRH
jgi:hypothetical protein